VWDRELTHAIAARQSKPKEHDFSLIVVASQAVVSFERNDGEVSRRRRFPIDDGAAA